MLEAVSHFLLLLTLQIITYRLIFKLLRDALIPVEALGLRGKECLQEYLKCSLEKL